MAPTPRLRKIVVGIMSIPARAMTTISPLKKTVLLAVAPVRLIALTTLGDGRHLRPQMNALTTNQGNNVSWMKVITSALMTPNRGVMPSALSPSWGNSSRKR